MAYDIGKSFEIVQGSSRSQPCGAPESAAPEAEPDGLNRENIRRVRDFIEALPPGRFDMGMYLQTEDGTDYWGVPFNRAMTECGTAACIAGWTLCLLNGRALNKESRPIIEGAGQLLGISMAEATALFVPQQHLNATNAQAVAVLDNLINTGRVDWSVAEKVS